MLNNAPLKSLRFFEAAARNLSFKRAAEELNVTPAAVGQQIKTLEDFLGVKLFIRLTRQITLSEEGQAIFPGVREGLEKIDTTLNSLQKKHESGILSVTTVHSFAAKWLFPRLGKFSLAHPDIDVRLTATRKVMDFEKDHIDIAIRISPTDPKSSKVDSLYLFGESFLPVCSPDLIKNGPSLQTPSDLKHHTLIHDDTMMMYQDCDWKEWFKRCGVSDVDTTRGPHFNPSTMPIQAAINGLGVALARKTLIGDDLEQGKLIAPFDVELPANVAYYLVFPKESPKMEKIHAFRDWIVDEASDLSES